MLRKKNEIGKTSISIRQAVTAVKMKAVKELLREFFDVMDVPDDELAEEVPVGIEISDCAFLEKSQAYAGQDEIYFGVLINSEQGENAEMFLQYIFQEH